MHLLACACFKADNRAGMFGVQFCRVRSRAIAVGTGQGKRLVDINNKIVFKIFQWPAGELGGVTHNFILARNDLHIRSTVKSINYYKRAVAFWEREPE